MPDQADKATLFRALHERSGAFVIPNPWDAGSARLLAGLGFEALATTSLGLANMLGRPDSTVTRAEVIANCREIAEATDLPMSRRRRPKPSGWPARRGRSAARSRISPATPRTRSTISSWPWRASRRRWPSPAACRCPSW